MRTIDYIVIHCTATDRDTTTVDGVLKYWREEKGWSNPGYHYIVKPDGEVVKLLGMHEIANGARGYNKHSLHICWIGGEFENDMTDKQRASIYHYVRNFMKMFPGAEVVGHRDLPGVKKACPRFDVRKEFAGLFVTRDPIVDKVREDLFIRSQKGIKKYGNNLKRDDLSELDWMQHHYEELLDAALYVKRRIEDKKDELEIVD